jgi:putative membrane protein
MILLGSINTLVMAISFITLYLINKARTGAASTIQQIMQITPKDLIFIIAAVIIAAAISILITSKISKFFAKKIHKINYSKISFVVLLFLIIIITIFSGFLGFFILTISTILGLTCIYTGIRRGFLMGALLIPTILFYLPF